MTGGCEASAAATSRVPRWHNPAPSVRSAVSRESSRVVRRRGFAVYRAGSAKIRYVGGTIFLARHTCLVARGMTSQHFGTATRARWQFR